MSAPVERIDAVCTIIFCHDRLLLVYNEKWGTFMLPVTKLRNRQLGLTPESARWELGEEAALRNVAECLWLAPDRWPHLLMDFGDLRQSDRSGKVNHYAFQLFGFEAHQPEAGPGVIAHWLTAAEILDPVRRPVSPTARALVRALQEAALSRENRFPPSTTRAGRTSVSSIAVIGHDERGEKKWLCQWNDSWKRYFLVGGHQHKGENAEQCMIRELREELNLTPGSEYHHHPGRRLRFNAWSTGTWQMTDYDISTFDVQLNPSTIEKAGSDAANRWVTAQELRSDRCADDKLISPTARRILATLGDLPGAEVDWTY